MYKSLPTVFSIHHRFCVKYIALIVYSLLMHKLKLKIRTFQYLKKVKLKISRGRILKPGPCFVPSREQSISRFGGYLTRFNLASDWSWNSKHWISFLWCLRFYGKDCQALMFTLNNSISHSSVEGGNRQVER